MTIRSPLPLPDAPAPDCISEAIGFVLGFEEAGRLHLAGDGLPDDLVDELSQIDPHRGARLIYGLALLTLATTEPDTLRILGVAAARVSAGLDEP